MTKLACEKNLNKYVYPVVKRNHKQITYPFEIKDNGRVFTCDQGIFGAKNFMIMDILGTYAIHGVYNKMLKGREINFHDKIPTPTDHYVKKLSGHKLSRKILDYATFRLTNSCADIVPDTMTMEFYSTMKDVDPPIESMKECISISINDGFLRNQLPFLRKYSSVNIRDMIIDTARCKIKTYYPIRFFDGKKFHNYPFDNHYLSMPFFSLVDISDGKKSKSGAVLNRNYHIRFDTVLGYMFMQNCMSAYTDLLPDKFYRLSDYAQLLYRKLILPYYDDLMNPIKLEIIKKQLVLTSDSYGCRNITKRILRELKINDFINDPKEEIQNGEYVYSYTKRSWKSMNNQQPGHHSQKVVTII